MGRGGGGVLPHMAQGALKVLIPPCMW